jgi:hypothetical protein
MKIATFFVFLGFGIAISARLNAQEPVYVPSVQSCLSIRNGSDGAGCFTTLVRKGFLCRCTSVQG